MKKLLTLILTGLLAVTAMLGLTACGNKGKVVSAGSTIIVGVTDYPPLDYIEDGNWVGFDAELATAVFTNLGYKVEFKEIDWDTKIVTLNAGTIDCIWNGMTVNDQLLSNLLLTSVYLKNQQVAVVKTTNLASYTNLQSLNNKIIAIESGSAAEDACDGIGTLRRCTNQNAAVLEVASNTSDVAIVDYAVAKSLTTGESEYAGTLSMVDIGFEVEEFSAAVRKSDSKLLWQINKEIAALTADGTIDALAEKYEISNLLPSNFTK